MINPKVAKVQQQHERGAVDRAGEKSIVRIPARWRWRYRYSGCLFALKLHNQATHKQPLGTARTLAPAWPLCLHLHWQAESLFPRAALGIPSACLVIITACFLRLARPVLVRIATVHHSSLYRSLSCTTSECLLPRLYACCPAY